MSGENRSNTTPSPPVVVYTVYPVDFQGNSNFGFKDDNSQTPPPKYEDVISGEYLKSNYSSYNYPLPLTTTSTYQSPMPHGNCTCSRTNTLRSDDSSEEDYKHPKCSAGFCVLIIFILVSFFVWRVSFPSR